ncbi:hypothetical protein NFI96_027592 [Prochilodus magdalenae]|nr:hypothetical protein NFI96_027592 [Prochilodus magdalenae]
MESLETTVQKKPGEALSLSCRGSGFNFGGYGMNWIRQQAGNSLEWIGAIWYDASKTIYAKPVEGRLEITRENSRNMVYLKLTGLTAQDSAVYYCARDHSGANISSSTNTMLLTSVLLLLMAGCVHSQVVLTQSEGSVTVAPGGSYKLTCACSGFNPSGNWMSWVRQAPGKGLEWIIAYFIERIKHTTQSVQGRFTASKDSSNFYLHMSQLKPEDTAVYYCATHSGGTHTDSCTRTRVEDKHREGDSVRA